MKKISTQLTNFLKDFPTVLEALQNREDSKDYFDLSISDPSRISYFTPDRVPEENLIWDDSYRITKAYHTKIGKLISDKVSNEVIVAISKKLFERKSDYKVFVSTEICKYYLADNYSKDERGGSLHNSCMRYAECQDYIKAYEIFGPDIVKIAVILDNRGDVLARALLWKCKQGNKNVTYLDRVYAVNDNIESVMYSWAESEGYLMYDNESSLTVAIDIDQYIPLPYFDTFRYYDGTHLNQASGKYCLDDTEGSCLNILGGYICYSCGDGISEGDECYVESAGDYYCSCCCTWSEYEERYIIDIAYSDYEGTYFTNGNEDFVYSENLGDWILEAHAYYDEETSDWYSNDAYEELIKEREANLETVS